MKGSDGMYLTVENINTFDNIISSLDAIESEKEQKDFLDKYVEDPELLSEMIKKMKQCKFSLRQVKHNKSNLEIIETDLYCEDEIRAIFTKKK